MLVFELARGCYAAILPGIDAGEAMRLAVDLDDVLTTTAKLYKEYHWLATFFISV